MNIHFLRPGEILFLTLLPAWITAGIVIFCCSLAYLALFYFAYRRHYALPKRFHVMCLAFAVLLIASATLYSWPVQFKLPGAIFTSFAFSTCLLGAYLCLAAVDLFVTDYYLSTVRRVYISPPLRKLIRLIAFFIAVFVSMNFVFSFNPLTRIATVGVGGLALGLALQDTLKGIIAGLSLGRLLRLGDWVRIKEMEGRVIDLTWSRLTLMTTEGDYIFIPNKEIEQTNFLNYSAGQKAHRTHLEIAVSYSADPQNVKSTLIEAAKNSPQILTDPSPEAVIASFGDSGIIYNVFFWLDNYGDLQNIIDGVATRVWHAFREKGFEIPFPVRRVYIKSE